MQLGFRAKPLHVLVKEKVERYLWTPGAPAFTDIHPHRHAHNFLKSKTQIKEIMLKLLKGKKAPTTHETNT